MLQRANGGTNRGINRSINRKKGRSWTLEEKALVWRCVEKGIQKHGCNRTEVTKYVEKRLTPRVNFRYSNIKALLMKSFSLDEVNLPSEDSWIRLKGLSTFAYLREQIISDVSCLNLINLQNFLFFKPETKYPKHRTLLTMKYPQAQLKLSSSPILNPQITKSPMMR